MTLQFQSRKEEGREEKRELIITKIPKLHICNEKIIKICASFIGMSDMHPVSSKHVSYSPIWPVDPTVAQIIKAISFPKEDCLIVNTTKKQLDS